MTKYEPGTLIKSAMNLFERQGPEIQAIATPYLIKHDLVFAYINDFNVIESIVVVDITTNPMMPKLIYAGQGLIKEYFKQ